ncbi:unnamed protein product [Effrenium voratum]|nr:unnamed protein product [Effrenium voratum]
MAFADGASALKGHVVGKFHANAEETFAIVIHNTSIEVYPWPTGLLAGGTAGLREPRSQSQSPAARVLPALGPSRRWTLPWDAPSTSALERHQSGRCDPCLFFTRKADGCRKGDACAHCHICTWDEAKRRKNRHRSEQRKAMRQGERRLRNIDQTEKDAVAGVDADDMNLGCRDAMLETMRMTVTMKSGRTEEMLLVSRSGKAAGALPCAADFVAVRSFSRDAWSCDFSASPGVQPTSDTPLHWACLLRAPAEFQWPSRPKVSLHGHALAEKAGLKKAEELQLPISHEETLFSTPEDVEALMKLFQQFPYPQNRVFIRRGHGFLILAPTVDAAIQELKALEKHFEKS